MKKIFSVLQINRYLKGLLDDDVILSEVFIRGEISNFKGTTHFYFTLKEDTGAISCVMFKNHTLGLKFKPQNGMKVIVFGRISLYEATGNCQVYVELIKPVGEGELHSGFLELKDKLQKEGLFDEEFKKPLPPYPKTIALITSPTGAVVMDMIRVAKSKETGINSVLIPVLVQGADAPASIVQALDWLNSWGEADVAVLARGGGSTEDLWAFNQEEVARAIFASYIPVVSAVGHETDFTIADFVADKRAGTPSMAMEIVLPDKAKEIKRLNYLVNRLNYFSDLCLERAEQRFKTALKDLKGAADLKIMNCKHEVRMLSESLNNLSPLSILDRGYALITKNGKIIKNPEDIQENDLLTLRFKTGALQGRLTDIKDVHQ